MYMERIEKKGKKAKGIRVKGKPAELSREAFEETTQAACMGCINTFSILKKEDWSDEMDEKKTLFDESEEMI